MIFVNKIQHKIINYLDGDYILCKNMVTNKEVAIHKSQVDPVKLAVEDYARLMVLDESFSTSLKTVLYFFVRFNTDFVIDNVVFNEEGKCITITCYEDVLYFDIRYFDYNDNYFRWDSETFKSKNKYILQIYNDKYCVFNKYEVRKRLGSNIRIVDNKMVFKDEVSEGGYT